jgi:ketosteroid isomerase-like protein
VPGADDTTALFEEVRAELELGAGTVLAGQQMVDLIEELLRERAHPEYETVMVPVEGPPLTHHGVAGFREALADWLSPWNEFSFEIEEILPVDDMIVMMVRQTGTTKHGGVEITTESGTVWWIQDERIRRASFYLDRDAARKVAGIG